MVAMRRSTPAPSAPPDGAQTRGEVNVSAAIFLDQFHLAGEMLGKKVIESALATLPELRRREIEEALPLSWVSIETCRLFHFAVAEQIGQDPVVWHRQLTRSGLERTFSTAWRFFLRLVTVEALIKRVAAIYERSYDCGKMNVRTAESRRVVAELEFWPDVPEFELDAMTSGIEALLHVSGRKGARVVRTRRPGGALFEIRFV
jgi:hypothetical protein